MLFTTYTSRLSIIIMIMFFYISMTSRDVNGVCQNDAYSALNGFTWLDFERSEKSTRPGMTDHHFGIDPESI